MRIGVIARCEESRGLAIQAKNFYDHMPVDKVLCVRMPRPDGVECPEWYENRMEARYDPRRHELEEGRVRSWLRNLDIVWCVETPHDWRIPLWCKEMGVKLVIQGNPEFVRHMRDDGGHLAHPDQWWWPTKWRMRYLPEGIHMPVPMERRLHIPAEDERLHVLHVIGKRAFGDRNGTEILVQAMRMVRSQIKLTVCSIDGDIIPFARSTNVEFDLRPNGVSDRWSLYRNQDLLVLPRRYGGLCLPALEANACGLVVAMTDCSPNDEFATVFFPSQRKTNLTMACGVVVGHDANARGVAATFDLIAGLDIVEWTELRIAQRKMLPTWDEYRPKYLAALEAVCAS